MLSPEQQMLKGFLLQRREESPRAGRGGTRRIFRAYEFPETSSEVSLPESETFAPVRKIRFWSGRMPLILRTCASDGNLEILGS